MNESRGEGISLAVILSGSIVRYAVLPHIYMRYIYIYNLCMCYDVTRSYSEPMKPKLNRVETGTEVNRRE